MITSEIKHKFMEHWVSYDESNIEASINVKRSIQEAKAYLHHTYGTDIPDTYIEDFANLLSRTDETVVSFSDFCRVRTALDLSKTPELFFAEINAQKDNENFWKPKVQYQYGLNKKQNVNLFINDMLNSFIRNEHARSQLFQNNEKIRDKIKNLLQKLSEELSENLISCYANAIAKSINIMKSIGILDRQVNKNNDDRRSMGGDILIFEMTREKDANKENKKEPDKYSIEDLTDVEMLKKLPIEKLALLYAFYSNRLTKVIQSIGLGLFMCCKVNDLDVNNKNIDMPKAMEIYSQYSWIDSIYTAVNDSKDFDIRDYAIKIPNNNKMVQLNTEKVYESIFKRYEEPFSLMTEGKGNLYNESVLYFLFNGNGYVQKDSALKTALLIAMENFEKVNWGYIPEIQDGKNSIEQKRRMILLGFDIYGFNMPVRLHMPLEMVEAVIKSSNQYTLPNYVGHEDFYIDGKNIGAQIVALFSPTHRKQFIDMVNEMDTQSPYYNFFAHIKHAQYDNNLKRMLKWKNGGRNGVNRTYTNIKNGKVTSLSKGKD